LDSEWLNRRADRERKFRSPQGAEKNSKSKWAEQTGVNKSTLSLIENGRFKTGSLEISRTAI